MADLTGRTGNKDIEGKPRRHSLPLKYYIHDSIHGLRFQLLGSLNETDVRELEGCWNTARTILGKRQLIVDLRALQSTDEAGKQWLLSLAHEGAYYLPESYFRSGLAPQESFGSGQRIGILSRLFSVFRSRAVPAESSTRAQ